MSLYGKEKGVKVEGGFRGYLVFRRLHQFPYMGKIPRQTLLRSRPRYLTPPNGLFPRGSLSAFEILSAFFPLSKDFSASPMHALCRGRKEKKKKRGKRKGLNPTPALISWTPHIDLSLAFSFIGLH